MLTLISGAAPGCEGDPDWELWFADASPPSEPLVSPDPPEFEFVQEYGDAEVGLAFGRILDMAVSEAGVLAVVDEEDCRIWWIDTAKEHYRTSGGCGDGPGEFRAPVSATFLGDTLVVLDEERAALSWLGPDGRELARARLPFDKLGIYGVSHVHGASTGALVLDARLLPTSMTSSNELVAIVRGTELELEGRGVRAPLIGEAPDVRMMARAGSICVGPDPEHGVVVVSVSTWGPQLAAFRGEALQGGWSVRVPLPWVRPVTTVSSGERRPVIPRPTAACGSQYAVVAYRTRRSQGGVLEVSRAAIVVVNLADGSMGILGGDEPPPEGSLLFMSPLAATGDRFFFGTNGFFGHPVVREYRLVSGPEGG